MMPLLSGLIMQQLNGICCHASHMLSCMAHVAYNTIHDQALMLCASRSAKVLHGMWASWMLRYMTTDGRCHAVSRRPAKHMCATHDSLQEALICSYMWQAELLLLQSQFVTHVTSHMLCLPTHTPRACCAVNCCYQTCIFKQSTILLFT